MAPIDHSSSVKPSSKEEPNPAVVKWFGTESGDSAYRPHDPNQVFNVQDIGAMPGAVRDSFVRGKSQSISHLGNECEHSQIFSAPAHHFPEEEGRSVWAPDHFSMRPQSCTLRETASEEARSTCTVPEVLGSHPLTSQGGTLEHDSQPGNTRGQLTPLAVENMAALHSPTRPSSTQAGTPPTERTMAPEHCQLYVGESQHRRIQVLIRQIQEESDSLREEAVVATAIGDRESQQAERFRRMYLAGQERIKALTKKLYGEKTGGTDPESEALDF